MGVNRRVDLRGQLSPEQQAAIKKDTRLVGEIAWIVLSEGGYGSH